LETGTGRLILAMSIYLLSTHGCHLCDAAKAICDTLDVDYEEVDIVEDEQLVDLYGDKIPVIMIAGAQQALFWPFTKEHINQYLESYGINSN